MPVVCGLVTGSAPQARTASCVALRPPRVARSPRGRHGCRGRPAWRPAAASGRPILVPRCMRPRMAVQQHHRLPVAAVPYAQRHLADVDIFEREAFEHELLRPARRPRVGRGRRRLTRCPIDPGSRPRAASTTDWHGHRAAWGISVRVMPRAWAGAVHVVESTRIAVRRLKVAATRGSCTTTGEADGVPTGGRAQLVLDVSGGERSSESGMHHFEPPLVYDDDSLKPER